MPLTDKPAIPILAGAGSGLFWFSLALAFDKGVHDFNYPVMPTQNVMATIACIVAAMFTGVFVIMVFSPLLRSASRRAFFLTPLVILPTAISIFSVLIWSVWLMSPDRHRAPTLATVLTFYLMYALMSPLFAPLTYVLCLLNQSIVRRFLGARQQAVET